MKRKDVRAQDYRSPLSGVWGHHIGPCPRSCGRLDRTDERKLQSPHPLRKGRLCAPTLARLTVPVLALNGSLDVQVPARENLAAAREALKENPKATVMELAGMNHLLQDAKTGAPSEYNDIDETMSPTALKIITDWLSVNVLTRRRETTD